MSSAVSDDDRRTVGVLEDIAILLRHPLDAEDGSAGIDRWLGEVE